MYLLDTNVVSALRRPDRHPAPTLWLKDQRASDVYISVVTFGEIERGIAQQIPRNPDFARDLAQWFERTLALFADRVLPVDVATARRWGRLSADLGHESADLHHRRDSPRTRPDRGHPQHQALRAHGRSHAQPVRRPGP